MKNHTMLHGNSSRVVGVLDGSKCGDTLDLEFTMQQKKSSFWNQIGTYNPLVCLLRGTDN